jgi:hypothetical protein
MAARDGPTLVKTCRRFQKRVASRVVGAFGAKLGKGAPYSPRPVKTRQRFRKRVGSRVVGANRWQLFTRGLDLAPDL